MKRCLREKVQPDGVQRYVQHYRRPSTFANGFVCEEAAARSQNRLILCGKCEVLQHALQTIVWKARIDHLVNTTGPRIARPSAPASAVEDRVRRQVEHGVTIRTSPICVFLLRSWVWGGVLYQKNERER